MKPPSHLRVALLLALCLLTGRAQTAPAATAQAEARPLPDVTSLMRQVETHQRAAERVEKDYLFTEDSTFNEVDGHGAPKKTEQRTFEIFWLNGVRVARVLKKDGKELSPDDQKKENERIDQEVARAQERRAKMDAEGKESDSHGHEEVTLSRILELGAFSNPRRQQINGRDTILIDFTGDPKAKTHNPAEGALKLLAGTLWVDEQDSAIARLEAHFVDNFKIGGGLVASVHKDTWFKLTNLRINNEVWLPGNFDAAGQARYLLFFSLNGNAHIRSSGYRKFKATTTIMPGVQTVDSGEPEAPGAQLAPSPTATGSGPSDLAHPPPQGSSAAGPARPAASSDTSKPRPAPPPSADPR